MDGGVEHNTTMRTSGGKAAPSSRWPKVLFRVSLLIAPLLFPVTSTLAATDDAAFDARSLLTLGINLGIIAFAVGTAIACLRATERARAAAAQAAVPRFAVGVRRKDAVPERRPGLEVEIDDDAERRRDSQ